MRGHVVLVGLGPVGVRTLEELDRLGERVVVVATAPDPRHRAIAARLAVGIVVGVPSDPDTLGAAGIPGARAIVLSGDSDIENMHAALAAIAAAPDLQVVIRVFDEELGRSITELIPDCVALSASALAAPGFVSAVVEGGRERHIEVLDRDLVLRHSDPGATTVLAAVADDSRSPVELFPDAAGSPLCLVDASGEPAEIVAPVRSRRRMRRLATPRPGAVRRIDRRFWVLMLVIVALVALSAAVLQQLTGMDPVDAVYEAMKGVMGGTSESVLSTRTLQFLALALTILGAVLLAAFYGLIADVILSARVSNLLGPHATDARDHVIVVGLGTIGFRIAVGLAEHGLEVVAAEMDPGGRFVEATRQRGIAVVTSDGRSPEALRQLRIDRARALVAVTSDDAANLTTALHARSLRPDLRIVVRLFDADLAARLDRTFGGFETRSVSALAAPAFASAAVGREVLATIPVGTHRILIVARVPIEEGSEADGSSVRAEQEAASQVERGGCRVLALVDADQVRWKPDPDTTVEAGQELYVVATRRGLATIVQRGEPRGGRIGLTESDRGDGVVWLRLPIVGQVQVPNLASFAQRLRDLVGLA
jgi:Trk K+ transport system NAD-binding subunit